MKMTVQEILEKLTEINDAINIVESRMDSYGRMYPGQEPLWQVINLLKEYELMLLSTKVDIGKEASDK